MCIGTPMQVIEMREAHALCESGSKQELVDMMLVGDQRPGTWVLCFLGSAREILTESNAKQITLALSAVDKIMNGEITSGQSHQEVNRLFPDIVNSEPRLPPHLQAQLAQKSPDKAKTPATSEQASLSTKQEAP